MCCKVLSFGAHVVSACLSVPHSPLLHLFILFSIKCIQLFLWKYCFVLGFHAFYIILFYFTEKKYSIKFLFYERVIFLNENSFVLMNLDWDFSPFYFSCYFIFYFIFTKNSIQSFNCKCISFTLWQHILWELIKMSSCCAQTGLYEPSLSLSSLLMQISFWKLVRSHHI